MNTLRRLFVVKFQKVNLIHTQLPQKWIREIYLIHFLTNHLIVKTTEKSCISTNVYKIYVNTFSFWNVSLILNVLLTNNQQSIVTHTFSYSFNLLSIFQQYFSCSLCSAKSYSNVKTVTFTRDAFNQIITVLCSIIYYISLTPDC